MVDIRKSAVKLTTNKKKKRRNNTMLYFYVFLKPNTFGASIGMCVKPPECL